MRAAIYTRVSSDPRETGRSVEEQEADCRSVCERQGWKVVRVFSDNDRSASRHAKKDRPQYVALRSFLEAGKADVLVMWEGSRAQRDLRDYLRLRDLCAKQDILYSYSGRTYDLSRTDDRFTTGLDALLAEREADVTRDRVLRAIRTNANSGRPHGKLLYGYRRTYDDHGTFIAQVVREDQAEVVREAASRVAKGEACRSVAVDFNQRGIPTPRGGDKGWDLTQVKRIVTNPAYAGKRVHRGEIVGDAVWPAILDEQTYTVCVGRLSDPRRKTVRDTTVKHLLSGTARCALCGGALRVQKNRGFYAYICSAKFCVSIKTTVLEDFVADALIARLSRKDTLDLIAPPSDEDDRQAAVRQFEELQERLEGWYAAAAKGEVSPAGLAAIEARMLPEIDEAKERAQPANVSPVLRDLVSADDVPAAWESLTIAQRREVVALVAEVKVGKTYQGARRFDPNRLKDSRWRGDTKTWGEHWMAGTF
ncbi:recombinase family protein [Micromonospora sp. WP24]|uniref:recombinase family protein n=1 Tax=Micromonospora sp. WP24 TaxID=2604469 RepID=UPI0016521BBE|nr:recombinase family protein [Micromonospora sp. WP24]